MTGTIERSARPPAVKCRAILPSDLDAVIELLVRGFPARPDLYWRRGLERCRALERPGDAPRLGFVLVSAEAVVGVLLTLYAEHELEGRPITVCNLSSWYVEPAFRPYATILDQFATRSKDTTYLNVSAVRRTWPMHEERGFQRFSRGQMTAAPLLSRPRRGATVCEAATMPGNALPEAEQRLLADHAGYGCVTLIGTDGQGIEPFVFIRRPAETIRQRLGWSPLGYFQLVYCRSIDSVTRFAHAIGRHLLLRHAMPVIVFDATGPVKGLVGVYVDSWAPKFTRGPVPMRLGDLSYTELVLFGP